MPVTAPVVSPVISASQPAVDETGDPAELVDVVERPVRRLRVVRPGSAGSRGLLGESGYEVVVDPWTGEHSGRRCAVLARVEVARHRDSLGRTGDVGVVEHDHRRLATELEVHALEVVRC